MAVFELYTITCAPKAVVFGSLVVTSGSKVVTSSPLVVTFGALVVTFEALVVTFGALVVTSEALVVTFEALVVTFEALVVTSGAKVTTFSRKTDACVLKVDGVDLSVIAFWAKLSLPERDSGTIYKREREREREQEPCQTYCFRTERNLCAGGVGYMLHNKSIVISSYFMHFVKGHQGHFSDAPQLLWGAKNNYFKRARL